MSKRKVLNKQEEIGKEYFMGTFLNRGTEEFENVLDSEIYVDKTKMITVFNALVKTEQRYVCISRPRRFGKTIAANMLAAYYEKGNDSRPLFEGRKLSACENWDRYMNRFDVIRIDFADIRSRKESVKEALDFLRNELIRDLEQTYPGIVDVQSDDITTALDRIHSALGNQFIIIIDEWDTIFRDEKKNIEQQKRYINLLRSLFKGNASKKFTALAYITGILPIKKYNSESALNNFREYTMVKPKVLAEYIGFTEEEVEGLCTKYGMDFEEAKRWYDGYRFGEKLHIYGPNSVVCAMLDQEYDNFWSQTVAYNSLATYITMNFDGLKDTILSLLSGNREPVYTGSFQNDMVSFQSKDDVLTVLIHLGYLSYEEETQTVCIPNEEVRQCFELTLRDTGWEEIISAINNSERLLRATLAEDEEEVAEQIDLCHRQNTGIPNYNDENCLSSILLFAYYTARKYYEVIREMPGGYGFADLVFVPKKNVDKPAMILELKWNKKAETAITQIKEKKYVESLKGYKGEVLLVGISYGKAAGQEAYKKHTCVIERIVV